MATPAAIRVSATTTTRAMVESVLARTVPPVLAVGPDGRCQPSGRPPFGGNGGPDARPRQDQLGGGQPDQVPSTGAGQEAAAGLGGGSGWLVPVGGLGGLGVG